MEPAASSEPSDDPVRIADAVAAAGLGAWDWNLRERTAWYSAGMRALLRQTPQGFPDRFETFFHHVHPEDIARVQDTIALHLKGLAAFDLEFRMRCGDGLWKWVRAKASASIEQGVAVRMTGTMNDWPLAAARDRLAMSASDRLAAKLDDMSRMAKQLEHANAEAQRQNQAL